jgi:FtsP/CotA-like multicopper oxidase with cupredoxin domain
VKRGGENQWSCSCPASPGYSFPCSRAKGTPGDEPFFRDTVLLHARETIGVIATDAGSWMLHCHILEHAEAGMMTTIRVE